MYMRCHVLQNLQMKTCSFGPDQQISHHDFRFFRENLNCDVKIICSNRDSYRNRSICQIITSEFFTMWLYHIYQISPVVRSPPREPDRNTQCVFISLKKVSVLGQSNYDWIIKMHIYTYLVKLKPNSVNSVKVEAHRRHASISPKAELKVHVVLNVGHQPGQVVKCFFLPTCLRSLFIAQRPN